MLWTIMPLEMVMDGSDAHQPEYLEIPYKSGMLVVEDTGQNTGRVVRLISTDPEDYLDPAIQPGSIINYRTKNQAVH